MNDYSLKKNRKAWKKFQAICEAQGGLKEPTIAAYQQVVTSRKSGCITNINNRLLARLAKLAGAPHSKSAGIDLHVTTDVLVEKKQPLFTLHAESSGELAYAMNYLEHEHHIIEIK